MSHGIHITSFHYDHCEVEFWECPYCGKYSTVIYTNRGEIIGDANCEHFNEKFLDSDNMFLEHMKN